MRAQSFLAAVLVIAVTNVASADTIRGINMDFVPIGHAGNAADNLGSPVRFGAVGYNYRIGKYAVTNAQWDEFTAVAGAPRGTDDGYSFSSYWTGAQKPTNVVSWYEAVQFCNYLTSGDKSKGAYQFSGNNAYPGAFQGINRTAAISAYGTAYVLPTEDEWYKAAYFKPDASGYSLYAFGVDTAPIAGVQTNYGQTTYPYAGPWNVGSGSQEQNGTYDMMGNLFQWTESQPHPFYNIPQYRILRGDCYHGGDGNASSGACDYPSTECDFYGFRVASIPEPASALLIGLGAAIAIRKQK
jgi:sulfatase modifying factor 1